MAGQRTATCPHCGAPRTSKANTGVPVVCNSCGARFRWPAPPAPAPAALEEPTADGELEAPATPAGPEIAVARPVVKQTARPRSSSSAKPADDADEPALEEPVKPAPPARQREHQEAGRRGGLAAVARSRIGRAS